MIMTIIDHFISTFHLTLPHKHTFERSISYKTKLKVFTAHGSEEREVFGFGSIPVAILPSYQGMKTIAL